MRPQDTACIVMAILLSGKGLEQLDDDDISYAGEAAQEIMRQSYYYYREEDVEDVMANAYEKEIEATRAKCDAWQVSKK